MKSAKILSGAVGTLLLAAVLPAGASISLTVTPGSFTDDDSYGNYSVTSSGINVGGATLSAQGASFSIDSTVTSGTLFSFSQATPSTITGGQANFTYSYTISINGSSPVTFSQDGTFYTTTRHNQGSSLLIGDGSAKEIKFYDGSTQYGLTITPNGNGNFSFQPVGSKNTSVSVGATYTLAVIPSTSAVPETSTVVAGAGGLGLLLLGVRGRSKRSGARIG
jgi:hypothetical protein